MVLESRITLYFTLLYFTLHCLHVPSEHESLPPDDGEHHAQSTSTAWPVSTFHTELPLAGVTAPHGCLRAENVHSVFERQN